MKKILFLAILTIMSILSAQSPKFFMPAKPAQIAHIPTPAVGWLYKAQQFFLPSPPQQEVLEIPTATIGWFDITDNIGDFQEILEPLSSLVEDPCIDAIIIRIDSGGGSPGDSQIIADYIKSANTQKPIIAFISRLSASGGYWIAAACSYIICPAAAEVGSIGVLSQFVFDKDKDYYMIATGIFKAPVVNQKHELDPLYIEQQKKSGNELANTFAQDIYTFRNIPVETILSWQGELFPGTIALKLGLVDQLGTMQDLLEKAVQLVCEKNNKSYEQLKLINSNHEVLKIYQI